MVGATTSNMCCCLCFCKNNYAFAEMIKEKIHVQVILEIKKTSLHLTYLRRAVEAALDVRVHGAVLKAG